MNGRTLLVAGVVAVSLASAGGCAPLENEGEGDVGSAASAAIGLNALSPLALDATASYSTALTPAMLSGTALAPDGLGGAALAAIEDQGASGALSRQLLSYTVGCALGPTQSFAFSWTDGSSVTHSESYAGVFGLATDWQSQPIAAAEQPWISACLIARVNYYGVHVTLSCRGDDAALGTTPAEISDFPYQEGAFWGDLFSATPTAYACDYVPDAAHSEAAWRVCSWGSDARGNAVSCGILQPLGSCTALCAPLTGAGGQYYPGCAVDPTSAATLTSEVITVFLQ